VEDCLTGSPAAVKALNRTTGHLMRLTAIELIVACQAVELRGAAAQPGPFLSTIRARVRAASPALRADRPLSQDIEALAFSIAQDQVSPHSGAPGT
jgi:histidine ammonia-lyase